MIWENLAALEAVLPVQIPPQNIDAHASVPEIIQVLQAHLAQQQTGSATYASVAKVKDGGNSTNLIIGPGGGGGDDYYDDYSSDWGWWDAGGGIDYAGSNLWSDGPVNSASLAPVSTHVDGSISKTDGSNGVVNVYFAGNTLDGKNGDQLVTENLNDRSSEILAATPGVTFVNVTATTNGAHDTRSDHYSGNAIDINQINGLPVSSAQGTTLALQLEAQALADPLIRYVEGPGGNWVRTEAGGQWIRSANLPTMNNHVHWSVFK